MGLDMYLRKKIYVGAEYEHRNVTGNIEIFVNGTPLPVNLKRVSEIEETVGYWRKANSIHKWFVDNVQDGVDECQTSYVSREQLQTLLDIVIEVLDHPDRAESLLPGQGGFFFGSTDYDNWYFDKLKYTKDLLEEIIKEEFSGDYYYHASW